MGYRLALLAAILALNAFFAAAEVALVSVRRSRLKAMAEEGQAGAEAALSLLANPERLLSVTQFGVTLTSLGMGWAGEETVYRLIVAIVDPAGAAASSSLLHGISFFIGFLGMSFAHVILGEVVPKNLALEKADRLALLVAPVLIVFYKVSSPFVSVMERSSAAISRAMGLKAGHGGGGHSAEELKFIIRSSWSEGHLETFEEAAIQRLLDLGDIVTREIMVPRNDIISLPVNASLDEVLRVMTEHKLSRVPVYDGSPEKIVGILHYKDLMRLWQERKWAHDRHRQERPIRLRRFLRKPLVVPESKPVSQLMADFRQHRTHLALVVDEFGTIAGLVTLEDLLEQIFGDIGDEYDVKAPLPSAEAVEITVEGTIPIRDLAAWYGIELPSEGGFETLAGFLLFKLGYIPGPGESVVHEDRRYTILAMERNRIASVKVERLSEPTVPAAGAG